MFSCWASATITNLTGFRYTTHKIRYTQGSAHGYDTTGLFLKTMAEEMNLSPGCAMQHLESLSISFRDSFEGRGIIVAMGGGDGGDNDTQFLMDNVEHPNDIKEIAYSFAHDRMPSLKQVYLHCKVSCSQVKQS